MMDKQRTTNLKQINARMDRRISLMELLFILGGGLLIIIFAVVISVVSSVVSAIAADQDQSED